MTNVKTTKYATLAAASFATAILLLSAGTNSAWAHASTIVPLPNDPSRGVRLIIGETAEPAYVDGIHNIEIIIRDWLTNMPIVNAHLGDLVGGSQLKVDAYFYPKGHTPGLTGNPPSPVHGYSDSSLNQLVKPQFGRVGYYEANNQWYSKTGLTLYHVYGDINYYGAAAIPIDVWLDGKNVKQGRSGSTTLQWGGGFGLHDKTQEYWPSSNDATHPDNIREAIGTIRTEVDQLEQKLNALESAISGIIATLQQIFNIVQHLE